MAVYPRLHKVLRRVYDVVGRALARRLRNPFVADLAYLCLKPVEWIACSALRVVVPEIDIVSKKMYL
jgi:hypothetical protein